MRKKVVFVLLATLNCFAQSVRQEPRRPSTGERSHVVWPKSDVTVVFAPEHPAPHSARPPRLDTLESWLENARRGGPNKGAAEPVEFAAPGGAIGVRLGPESAIATFVSIGDDGKRHVECARLPEALKKQKSAVPAAHPVEFGNDK